LYSKDGEVVSQFGFHKPLGLAGLATFLMDERRTRLWCKQCSVTAKIDMTLYYSHSSRKAKRAAVENYGKKIVPEAVRVPMRVRHPHGVN
jgi:hypothetical protein